MKFTNPLAMHVTVSAINIIVRFTAKSGDLDMLEDTEPIGENMIT